MLPQIWKGAVQYFPPDRFQRVSTDCRVGTIGLRIGIKPSKDSHVVNIGMNRPMHGRIDRAANGWAFEPATLCSASHAPGRPSRKPTSVWAAKGRCRGPNQNGDWRAPGAESNAADGGPQATGISLPCVCRLESFAPIDPCGEMVTPLASLCVRGASGPFDPCAFALFLCNQKAQLVLPFRFLAASLDTRTFLAGALSPRFFSLVISSPCSPA